jgi:hypothetical protein
MFRSPGSFTGSVADGLQGGTSRCWGTHRSADEPAVTFGQDGPGVDLYGPVAQEHTGDVSDNHHCPYCELIFTNLNELRFHMEIDHPDRHVPDRPH